MDLDAWKELAVFSTEEEVFQYLEGANLESFFTRKGSRVGILPHPPFDDPNSTAVWVTSKNHSS